MLGIPTVLDRLIQQAVHQELGSLFDPGFSSSSYGFRPGKSAHQAVQAARNAVESGLRWVVDIDLAQFFDRVNHDILMSRVARKVKDKRVLHLIRSYLQAGLFEGGVITQRVEGTPQGGPLSPLLSKALDRIKSKIREICRKGRGRNLKRVIEEITPILRGWSNYFKLSEVKKPFEELDGWIRRKLRCILWRQWKRPFTRMKKLMQRGLSEERAWRSALNKRGPWWNSGASHMNQAFDTSYFTKLGLLSLLNQFYRFQQPT
jgi:hypothetical protein